MILLGFLSCEMGAIDLTCKALGEYLEIIYIRYLNTEGNQEINWVHLTVNLTNYIFAKLSLKIATNYSCRNQI